MKEFSIEEKAKRYDEAIKKFDVILNLNTVKESGTIFADDVRKIFPELKESEDERIRKWCISHFRECFRVTKDNAEYQEYLNNKVIPWLEKQGETFTKKDVDDAYLKGLCDAKQELEKQGEQKSAWSEEDDYVIERLFCLLDNEQDNYPQLSSDFQEIEEIKNKLKSIKERYTWKPSKRQIQSIMDCALNKNIDADTRLVLDALYQDLKKLRGE